MNNITLLPDAEEAIDIPFWTHQRLKREAMDRYGASQWTPTHDRYVIRNLFARGIISDTARTLLLERVSAQVERRRQNDPSAGKFRLW